MGARVSRSKTTAVHPVRGMQAYEATDLSKFPEEFSRRPTNSSVAENGGRAVKVSREPSGFLDRQHSQQPTQQQASPIPSPTNATATSSAAPPARTATLNSSSSPSPNSTGGHLKGFLFPSPGFSPAAGLAANIHNVSGNSFTTTTTTTSSSIGDSMRLVSGSGSGNQGSGGANGSGPTQNAGANPNSAAAAQAPAIQVQGPTGINGPPTVRFMSANNNNSPNSHYGGGGSGDMSSMPPSSPAGSDAGRTFMANLPHRSVSFSSAQLPMHAIQIPMTAQMVSVVPGVPSIPFPDDQAEVFLRIVGPNIGIAAGRQDSVCSILRFAMAECEYHIQATSYHSSGSGVSPAASPRSMSPASARGGASTERSMTGATGGGGGGTQRRLTVSSAAGVTRPPPAATTGHRSSFTPIYGEALNALANKHSRCRIRVGNKPVAEGFLQPLNNGVWITFDLEPPLRPLNYIFTIPPFEEDSDDSDDEEPEVAYRRGELLGTGAYGAVYQGMNKRTGELIAIKTFSLSRVSGKSAMSVQQIEEEIAMLKRLNHQHIVKYLGVDRNEAELNILLEFVPGGSIASLVRRFGTFSESVIRLYTIQTLVGLQYLHANNVIHRDIKGANILVTERGQIKLADFGLSTAELKGGAFGIVGTAHWMAPEVINEGKSTKVSDLWSLGCTVLEMINGMPYKEKSFSQDIQIMFYIAQFNPPAIPNNISPPLNAFLKRCFTTDAALRPNCDDLLRDPFIAIPPSAVYEYVEEPLGAVGTDELDGEVYSPSKEEGGGGTTATATSGVAIAQQPPRNRSPPATAEHRSMRSEAIGSIQIPTSGRGLRGGIVVAAASNNSPNGGAAPAVTTATPSGPIPPPLPAPPAVIGASRIDLGLAIDRTTSGGGPSTVTTARGAAGLVGPSAASLSPFPLPHLAVGVMGAAGPGALADYRETSSDFSETASSSSTPRTNRSGRPGRPESVVSFGSRVSIRRTSSHAKMRKEVRAHKAHIRGQVENQRRTSTAGGAQVIMVAASSTSSSSGGDGNSSSGLGSISSPSSASGLTAAPVGMADLPIHIGSPLVPTSSTASGSSPLQRPSHGGTSPRHNAKDKDMAEPSSSIAFPAGMTIAALASAAGHHGHHPHHHTTASSGHQGGGGGGPSATNLMDLPAPPGSVNLMASDLAALTGEDPPPSSSSSSSLGNSSGNSSGAGAPVRKQRVPVKERSKEGPDQDAAARAAEEESFLS